MRYIVAMHTSSRLALPLAAVSALLLVLTTPACAPAADGDPLATSEDSLTSDWRPLLVCNGGAAVVDVDANERRHVQLVVRDGGALRYLHDAGAVRLDFGATEAVVAGETKRVDWSHELGPRVDGGARGVFHPDDFREMLAGHTGGPLGRFVRVTREGSGVKVQFGQIEPRGCASSRRVWFGDGNGWKDVCVADYSAYVEKANWFFDDCR